MEQQNCTVSEAQSNYQTQFSCTSSEGEYSITLHIVAIFALLVASFIGTMLPLVGKYLPILQIHPFVIIIGKCISSGVVMSVALVHMMSHGAIGFMKDCVPASLRESFDAFAFLFAMTSAMLMHMMDIQMDSVLEKWVNRDAIKYGEESGKSGSAESSNSPDHNPKDNDIPNHDNNHNNNSTMGGCHSHGALAIQTRLNSIRRIASAIFMEFGLALHSVFLGVSVGVASDAETRALLVALTFHQVFEGLALGSRLAEASMRFSLELILTLIYSFSVPLGTAIGVATIKGANISMTGTTFITIQAIFDSICSGILLYLGFVLLLNDFPEDLRKFAGEDVSRPGLKRFAMFLSLWLGAAIMTVLAKWA